MISATRALLKELFDDLAAADDIGLIRVSETVQILPGALT
jgi:hypothetical protein